MSPSASNQALGKLLDERNLARSFRGTLHKPIYHPSKQKNKLE